MCKDFWTIAASEFPDVCLTVWPSQAFISVSVYIDLLSYHKTQIKLEKKRDYMGQRTADTWQSVSDFSKMKVDVPQLIHAPVQQLTSTYPRLAATRDICP